MNVGKGEWVWDWFVVKDHRGISYDFLYLEANSVVGRWESRHAGRENSSLVIQTNLQCAADVLAIWP